MNVGNLTEAIVSNAYAQIVECVWSACDIKGWFIMQHAVYVCSCDNNGL